MKYDYLIVGAGLFGAVFAQEAKKAKDPVFRFMPLAVTLLFGFYHPVVLFSGIAPTVGLFIIP